MEIEGMEIKGKVVDGKLQTTPEEIQRLVKAFGPTPDEGPPVKKMDSSTESGEGEDAYETLSGVKQSIINNEPLRITFRQGQAPGDVVVLTAAIRDLKMKFPNLQINMKTTAPQIWENNPHVSEFSTHDSFDPIGSDLDIKLGYPLVHQANQCGKHFIHGFKEEIERNLGISFEINAFKCDLHLSDEEKGWVNQVEETFDYAGKFWLINSGSKDDFPLKQWRRDRWQEVVDALKGKIQFVQVGEEHHNHEPLEGAFNLLGKTDMRQLIRLCYHAEGAACHVTMLNHLMSVWEKPCVVIAGGRETSAWESYNETTYLDTIGALPCCKSGGCWKSKIEDCLTLERPEGWIDTTPRGAPIPPLSPKCMNMITSTEVVRAIEKYYVGGRL
jgi:ADP-heptose:LPS heptosyltransferase